MDKNKKNTTSNYKSNTTEYLFPDTKAGKKAKKKAESLSVYDYDSCKDYTEDNCRDEYEDKDGPQNCR